MNELLAQLALPFEPKHLVWKPGATKDNRCMALAYCDLRAYQERLDQVCGLDWHVEYLPWGESRIIARLTIAGTTRASSGEMSPTEAKGDNGGTVAEAQAFKRAAAMFGLGRSLYDLPSPWVEFDPSRKRITDAGLRELESRYSAWYAKKMAASAKNAPAPHNDTRDDANAPSEAATFAHDGDLSKGEEPSLAADLDFGVDNPFNDDAPASAESADKVLSRAQLTRLNVLGVELYGTNKAWNAKRPALVLAASSGSVESSKQLTPAQAELLIAGLHKRVEQKRAAEAQKRSERTAEARLPAHHQAALNGTAP